MARPKKTKEEKVAVTGPRSILITGAAGYVGAMLADQFSQAPDLDQIIAIDMNPMPEVLKDNKKIHWICSELSTGDWQEEAAKSEPEVVIHCAWQIEELYDEENKQKMLNIGGSENVFDFAFSQPSVKKIIHFSSISAYGAFDSNKKDNLLVEGDILKEDEYLYGIEKKEVENILAKKYAESDRGKTVVVLRPSTVIGPRAKYMSKKKGLFYAMNNIPIIPIANDDWGRQYVHEDDLTDLVAIFTFSKPTKGYEVFNITSNNVVSALEMAAIFKKETIGIVPLIVRIIFFFAWHISQGKFSTGKGAWKLLSYPLFVDGSKVTKKLGYNYTYSSKEALEKDEGRYDYAIPKKEEKIEEGTNNKDIKEEDIKVGKGIK